jgi:hypothetical protein
MIRHYLLRFKLLLLALLFLLTFTREWPQFGDEFYQITQIIGQRQFDFLSWEVTAVSTKAEAVLANNDAYLDEATRKQTVLDYLSRIQQSQQLENEIKQIYTDAAVQNPDVATAVLQTELAQTRAQIEILQPIAEAIVQDQVGTILAEEEFGLLGQAWPPVMMHMTPLPTLLIVSPRDQIERIHGVSLAHGLSTPEKVEIETAVSNQLNLSAIVVPIGGLGTYPAMITETSNINWLLEVTAHEWSHHWLSFFPVGWSYNDPQVRIINETVASLIDQKIANRVIDHYYPEFAPPPTPPASLAPDPSPNDPPQFDFAAEMAATRIRAEELLAEGDIEGAEAYMEARRQIFVQNGVGIRVLNQAYFAFYGAYASQPGAAGNDPTGPMLRDIQANTPSTRAFMETIAPITTFADLERIWAEVMGGERP